MPLGWAITNSNLGNALRRLGDREQKTATLRMAVEAYGSALEVLTRERVPLAWAQTQHNLGRTLRALARHETGTKHLEEATAAYRAAIQATGRWDGPDGPWLATMTEKLHD